MILTPDNEYTVVLDSCVLVPMPLCDTLLRLAEEPGLFRPVWSEKILSEVGHTLETKLKCTAEQRDWRIKRMRAAFEEAIVDTPQTLIDSLDCIPDPKDRHVLAAAIMGHAHAIVTTNTKDFPNGCLEIYGVQCQHPDDFLIDQHGLAPARVMSQLELQAADIHHDRAWLMAKLRKAVPKFSNLVCGQAD